MYEEDEVVGCWLTIPVRHLQPEMLVSALPAIASLSSQEEGRE